ncbi:RadC family protein [Gilvibacter sediminis]|uniref:RadC family protein n=1 Tax=Gilvibacter sediminis TaxID=379071 RepID=UPI00234FBFC5|nr:DNA repair protein RadC [Gilvibacter sediminis]MDC7997607.1 DNA repair protein RadC [Gilvibacter sediminis]
MTNSSQKDSLKQIPNRERPRERLMSSGAAHLTAEELLAILLRSGNKDVSALGLARKLLKEADHRLDRLSRAEITELLDIPGIGLAKAATVVAAFELGRRSRDSAAESTKCINSSAAAYTCMEPLLGHLDHEEFWVLFLNNAHGVLARSKISSGGYTGTLVDVRIILKKALLAKAVGMILVHNHPSGTLKPSQADIALTQKIVKAAKAIDVTVLDHLIVTEKAYFSFADKHLL